METNKETQVFSKTTLCCRKKINRFFSLLIYAIILGLFSSCDVSEEKIIGTWEQDMQESSVGSTQYVAVKFNADHTGEMVVYSSQSGLGGYERGAIAEFDWSVDGYLVVIEGTYYDCETYEAENFTTKFRYKDSKLVCEDILPGLHVNLASPYRSQCVLTKK